ncbi:MAG: PstS family phosphate ABC transporter substrate-binding protein [Chloroflexi bacterium]|nr:PstS family phosphate ABC transporter substrate-binding protein [Chloroflexota bacterium]
MQHTIRTPSLTFAALLALGLLAACGGSASRPSLTATSTPQGSGSLVAAQPTPTAAPELKGTINVSGAFALYPLMIQWSEEFQKLHPNVRFNISAGGAGKGMSDALGGLVEIGMVSREISPNEVERGAFYVASAIDAVVPVTNAANPLREEILSKGLRREDFANIWITGKVTDWKDLYPGAKAFGDTALHVYTRSDAAGAPETWAAYLGKKQENLLGIGVFGDPGLAEAVRRDPVGAGFNNVGYAYDASAKKQNAGLLVIPIDINGNGAIDPDENFYEDRADLVEAIANRVYPYPPARPLYLVGKGPFTGVAKEFVTWILTDGQKFNIESGYVPISQDRIKSDLEKLQ